MTKIQTVTDEISREVFQVLPLSDLMGAEIIGLDLSQPLDDRTRDQVHDAFLKYQVIVFRDQKLTKQQQVTFTEQFGPAGTSYAAQSGHQRYPVGACRDQHGR